MAAATAGLTGGLSVVSADFCAFTRAMAAAIASSPPVCFISPRRLSAACLNRFSRSCLSRSRRCCLSSKRCLARSASLAS